MCVSGCFAGLPGEGLEPHDAQPHSGLHRLQMGVARQEEGEKQMSAGRAALECVIWECRLCLMAKTCVCLKCVIVGWGQLLQ